LLYTYLKNRERAECLGTISEDEITEIEEWINNGASTYESKLFANFCPIPRPDDDGRTYVFSLLQNVTVRFSLVNKSNKVIKSFEKNLEAGIQSVYFDLPDNTEGQFVIRMEATGKDSIKVQNSRFLKIKKKNKS
jgi:hypothetical protein